MRGFAGTLQTDHHNDRRRFGADFEFCRIAPHQLNELFVDDFDDLLCRHKAFENLCTDCTLCNGIDKRFCDLKVNVRLQKSQFYVPHTFFHIGSGQFTFIAETAKGISQFFC